MAGFQVTTEVRLKAILRLKKNRLHLDLYHHIVVVHTVGTGEPDAYTYTNFQKPTFKKYQDNHTMSTRPNIEYQPLVYSGDRPNIGTITEPRGRGTFTLTEGHCEQFGSLRCLTWGSAPHPGVFIPSRHLGGTGDECRCRSLVALQQSQLCPPHRLPFPSFDKSLILRFDSSDPQFPSNGPNCANRRCMRPSA
jgi:hypothetical protein